MTETPLDGPAHFPVPPGTRVYDARLGATFEDVTSMELADRAVDDGRLILAHIVDPRFGGAEERVNQIPVPPQVQRALDAINDTISAAVRSGAKVRMQFGADYHGDSHVPGRLTYDTGDAGVHQILIW